MKNYEQIKTIEKNSSLIIQLSRPEKLNTFTEIMMREIIDALDWAEPVSYTHLTLPTTMLV